MTKYESDRVEIEADVKRPGLLILADVYYPGWRVSVDGRDAPIERANRLMRGVTLEKGLHTLVFRYDPLSFRAGIAKSFATLSTLLVCIALFDAKRETVLETHKSFRLLNVRKFFMIFLLFIHNDLLPK